MATARAKGLTEEWSTPVVAERRRPPFDLSYVGLRALRKVESVPLVLGLMGCSANVVIELVARGLLEARPHSWSGGRTTAYVATPAGRLALQEADPEARFSQKGTGDQ